MVLVGDCQICLQSSGRCSVGRGEAVEVGRVRVGRGEGAGVIAGVGVSDSVGSRLTAADALGVAEGRRLGVLVTPGVAKATGVRVRLTLRVLVGVDAGVPRRTLNGNDTVEQAITAIPRHAQSSALFMGEPASCAQGMPRPVYDAMLGASFPREYITRR